MARCPIFLSYDVNKCSQVVRDRKHCSNCLSHSHTASNCQSTYNCRKCNKRHHTFLHREVATKHSSTPAVTAPASLPASASTEVSASVASPILPAMPDTSEGADTPPILLTTLKTAIVDVIDGSRTRKAQATLDSGSSISLIT